MVEAWDDDLEGGTPASEGSALAEMRARRRRTMESLHTDLVVPRYDPPIFVRYGPVSQARIDAAQKRAEKSKQVDKSAMANAELLGEACLGVFEVAERDGEKVAVSIDPRDPSIDPKDWPRFDERLIEIFELECGPRVVEIVRSLYVTDGDVISTAAKLAEFSGYSTEDLERADEGN